MNTIEQFAVSLVALALLMTVGGCREQRSDPAPDTAAISAVPATVPSAGDNDSGAASAAAATAGSTASAASTVAVASAPDSSAVVGSAERFSWEGLPQGDFMRVIHVAPYGADSAAGTADAPFATLERARDEVRKINTAMTADILVAVAPGDYVMQSPFVLKAEDSGNNGHRVRYLGAGQPGSARLLGGTQVRGWQPVNEAVFAAQVGDDFIFNTLYENGIRGRKARFPNYVFDARYPLSTAPYLNAQEGSDTELLWQEGDLAAIDVEGLGDTANLVFWPWGYAAWQKVTRRIEGVDASRRAITVPENKGKVAIGKSARYYIEGSLQLLDQPGEFHLDRGQGVLYYWPRFGNPEQQEIIAPRLTRIISLEGDSATAPVQAVDIEGFELAFTDTFDAMTGPTLFPWSVSTDYGAHGSLHLRYTEDVQIKNNHIKGSGLNGIYLERSNKHNMIYGNWIEDAGISGIILAYHRERRAFPDDVNAFNRVENNLIHGLGQIAVDSAGITIWGGNDNLVANSVIHDGARYGITLRGPFTQRTFNDTNRPLTANNTIRNIHLYRLGQDSGDMGAIHMAGISRPEDHPVNTLENILIEDIVAHPSMKDINPNGIFFDYPEGVTDQRLINIEIRDTPQPFRTNRTDIRHSYKNVSWKEGFDPTKMHYEAIGLNADFPSSFGAPESIADVAITQGENNTLHLRWDVPQGADDLTLLIAEEGQSESRVHRVPVSAGELVLPRPKGERIVFYCVQVENAKGNRSAATWARAGVNPGQVSALGAKGMDGAVRLSWQEPSGRTAAGYVITVDDHRVKPLQVAAGNTEAVLRGLVNYKPYRASVAVVDEAGLVWPGASIRFSAGELAAPPADASALWTFNVPAVYDMPSIGDESGNGNTLFVGNNKVLLAEGKQGGAVAFDSETAYIRALSAMPLAIGKGDYAVSVWIRQEDSRKLTARFLDFGGTGSIPGLCLMANNHDVRLIFNDGTRTYSPFYRGLDMVGNWMHVVVNVKRDGNLDLYVNGERLLSEDISASAGIDIPAAEHFYLGRYRVEDPRYNWSGSMDQLRIYHRALETSEIAALYNEFSTPDAK